MTATTFIVKAGAPEVILTRVFDAPRQLVFKVCTDPKQIPNWWGPKSLITTVIKFDLKPGGEWRIVQRAPDGKEYVFYGEYQEVIPPERLVRTFEFEGMSGHVVTETMTFEDENGKTKLTISSLFKTIEDRDGMLKSGMESGATESMERLGELLVKS